MLWILLSILLFPFIIQALSKRREKRLLSSQGDIPGRVSRLIFLLSLKLPKKIQTIETRPQLCVWNLQVHNVPVAVLTKANHLQRMRIAFLAKGKTGLVEYIAPYLSPPSFTRFCEYINNLEV